MVSARRNAASKVHSNINVTPMVDVMLVLLIIFMIVTPMLNGPEVDLAKVSHPTDMPDVDRDDAVVVAVTHDNKIYLGTELAPSEELGTRVHDMIEKKTDKKVFLRSDKRARYGIVAGVVDTLRNQGVADLGLLTEPLHEPGSQDPPGLW